MGNRPVRTDLFLLDNDELLRDARKLASDAEPAQIDKSAILKQLISELPLLELVKRLQEACLVARDNGQQLWEAEATLQNLGVWNSDAESFDEMRKLTKKFDQFLERREQDLEGICLKIVSDNGYEAAGIYAIQEDISRMDCIAAVGCEPPQMRALLRNAKHRDIVQDVMFRCMIERRNARSQHAAEFRSGVPSCRPRDCSEELHVGLVVALDSFGNLRQDAIYWVRDETDHRWTCHVRDSSLCLKGVGSMTLFSKLEMEDPARIEKLIRFSVTHVAPAVYSTLPQQAVQMAASMLVRYSRADAGAIHMVTSGDALTYFTKPQEQREQQGETSVTFNIYGRLGDPEQDPTSVRAPGSFGGTPRPNGIGVEALRRGKKMTFKGDEVKTNVPSLYERGVRRVQVHPLTDSYGKPRGILYLHWVYQEGAPLSSHHEHCHQHLVEVAGRRLTDVVRCVAQGQEQRQRVALFRISRRILDRLKRRTSSASRLVGIAEELAFESGADLVSIRQDESRKDVIRAHHRYVQESVHRQRSFVSHLLSKNHEQLIFDEESKPILGILHENLRRAIVLPLRDDDGKRLGCLLLAYSDSAEFNQKWVGHIARMLSSALENLDAEDKRPLDTSRLEKTKLAFEQELARSAFEQHQSYPLMPPPASC